MGEAFASNCIHAFDWKSVMSEAERNLIASLCYCELDKGPYQTMREVLLVFGLNLAYDKTRNPSVRIDCRKVKHPQRDVPQMMTPFMPSVMQRLLEILRESHVYTESQVSAAPRP